MFARARDVVGRMALTLAGGEVRADFAPDARPVKGPVRVERIASAEAALAHLILPPWWEGARLTGLIVEDPAGEVAHERAIDRAKWHFAPRRVVVQPVKGGAA